MSYKALYIKYRPNNFDDVVGQNHIISTLKNIIESGKIGHAYLFAGPRGTGKTSVAHVFAREVNKNAAGNVVANELDIIEIDAASNNGVAEIRSVIDNARYAPTSSKFKVYIIDEVHMLTKGAFNALLKTLEEPPVHVIFILATTEPHKIPVTILSRCQRFNFRRMDDEVIRNQLREVLTKEEIGFDNEAIRFIAKLAQGGMRDALSIADQAAAYGNGNVTFAAISQVFGIISIENQIKLLNHAFEGRAKELLTLSTQFIDNGSDIERLTTSLLDVVKDFIVFKKTQDKSLLDVISESEMQQLAITINFAYEALDVLVKLLTDLRFSQVPRQSFELALLKLTSNKVQPTLVKEVAVEPIVEVKIEAPVSQVKVEEISQNIFETAEIKVEEVINTNELNKTTEMVLEEQQIEADINGVQDEILSTQEIPLHEINNVESSTEEIDLVAMFTTENSDMQDMLQPEASSKIASDEVINLLVQTEKERTSSLKRVLDAIEVYAEDTKSTVYSNLLSRTKMIASGQGFLLVSSEDESVVREINRERRDQDFIDFINHAFKEPMIVFAVTRDEFENIKEKYIELSRAHSLPIAKPVPQVKASKKRKSDEEEFGTSIFGDLFSR